MPGLPLLALVAAAAAAAAAAPANPAPTPRAAEKPSFNRHTGLFEPPFGELERAVGRGDRADIARWAARIGPARLAEALRGTDRPRVIAALEALAVLPGNVRLLDAVTPLVASTDVSVSERAARAMGLMLDASEPRRLEDWDVPADAVGRGCRALTDTVLRVHAPVEVRLAALDALADATLLCRPAPLALLGDPSAAVRRAALLAQRARDELPAAALKQGLADPDPTVVAATAVAWCRHRLAAGGTAAPPVTLPLRTLAAAAATPIEDAIELLGCLALSSDPADRKALEQLRKSRAVPLKTSAAAANGGSTR
jgi:hypothetical protein